MMTEKQQGTSAGMRAKMVARYGTEYSHKHDKNHLHYRKHYKTYPSHTVINGEESLHEEPTGQHRQLNLRRIRKRLAKGRFH